MLRKDLKNIYQFNNGNRKKSSVAKHLLEINHFIDISHIKLVEEVNENSHIILILSKLFIFEKINIRIGWIMILGMYNYLQSIVFDKNC